MFRKDIFKGKPTSRKIINYVDNSKSQRELVSSLYCGMLAEDIHLGIVPIGGKSSDPDFSVQINPYSKEVEELVVNGLNPHHGRFEDINEVVCDFIDEVAHILGLYGKAFYELVLVFSDKSRKKIEGFVIERINNYVLHNILGQYWQFLPKKFETFRDNNVKKISMIKRNDLLIFSIPKKLGGTSRYRKMFEELIMLGKEVVPEFSIEDRAKMTLTKGYDFSLYREINETYLAKITKQLGWTARLSFVERSFEFYQIYRHLKFEKSKAILRDIF